MAEWFITTEQHGSAIEGPAVKVKEKAVRRNLIFAFFAFLI